MVGYRYNPQKKQIDIFEDCKLLSTYIPDTCLLIPKDADLSDTELKYTRYKIAAPPCRCWQCAKDECAVFNHKTVWLNDRDDRKAAELLYTDLCKALKAERDELNVRYSSKLKACRDLHGGLMKDDLF